MREPPAEKVCDAAPPSADPSGLALGSLLGSALPGVVLTCGHQGEVFPAKAQPPPVSLQDPPPLGSPLGVLLPLEPERGSCPCPHHHSSGWGSCQGSEEKRPRGWGLASWTQWAPSECVAQLYRRSWEDWVFKGDLWAPPTNVVTAGAASVGARRARLTELGRGGVGGVWCPWPLRLHRSLPLPSGDPRPNPHPMARRSPKLHPSPRGQRWCPNCGRCAPGRHEALGPGPAPTGSAMASDQFHLHVCFISNTRQIMG